MQKFNLETRQPHFLTFTSIRIEIKVDLLAEQRVHTCMYVTYMYVCYLLAKQYVVLNPLHIMTYQSKVLMHVDNSVCRI